MSNGVLGINRGGFPYCTKEQLVTNVEFKKWSIRYRGFENVYLNDYRRGLKLVSLCHFYNSNLVTKVTVKAGQMVFNF
jgi:hypothetical protein